MSVDSHINHECLENMSPGVRTIGTKTLPSKVEQLSIYEFNIILTQGLNRRIRRMCEALDYEVYRLQRLRVMNIHLGNLPPGE